MADAGGDANEEMEDAADHENAGCGADEAGELNMPGLRVCSLEEISCLILAKKRMGKFLLKKS